MIVGAIENLIISKTPGPHGIHTMDIKDCKEAFSTVIHVIFRKSSKEALSPKTVETSQCQSTVCSKKENEPNVLIIDL